MELGDPAEPGKELTRWRLWEVIPLDRTQNQIHGRRNGDPEEQPTTLTRNITIANATPLGELDLEQLRVMIDQGEDEELLLPLALPALVENPMIGVTFFDGDLLKAVLATRGVFVQANPPLIHLLLRLVARVQLVARYPEDSLDSGDDPTEEEIAGQQARWLIRDVLIERRYWPWSPWNGFDWEAHWRIPDPLPLDRSLDQLEGRPGWWPRRPEGDVHRALDRASATPIGELGLDQVELLLRHQEGAPWLLPRALEAVGRDPLVRAGERPGDLLEALAALQLPELWRVHPLGAGIVRRALARVEQRALGLAADAGVLGLLERLERRGLRPRDGGSTSAAGP